jgi:hypothetical protein
MSNLPNKKLAKNTKTLYQFQNRPGFFFPTETTSTQTDPTNTTSTLTTTTHIFQK